MNNVKVTKTQNRKVGDTIYYKHMMTVPNNILDELGWSDKTQLEMKVSGKKLVIEKK